MHLVAGLGNPGRRYARNRHNAGFMLVDRLAEMAGTSFQGGGLRRSVICRVQTDAEEVTLAKPQTYMNNSGGAVAELLHHFPVPPENVLVVFDDFALPLGRLRLRRPGTSGGHKGMQSIIDVLGSFDISRLRIGVGAEQTPDDKPDYVLSDFSRAELQTLGPSLERGCEAVEVWVKEGIEKAMSKFNA